MWLESEFHLQNKEDVHRADLIICCDTTQFPELELIGPQLKPHGEQVLKKDICLSLYPKLVYVLCYIGCITCACATCTTILKNH